MFCPKCGAQNPETGKFCRNCGTDLGNVSDALAGKTKNQMFGMPPMAPLAPMMSLTNRKGKPVNWESAIGKIFSGLAFLTIAIILGGTGMAGGKGWWFWLLIPAFGALGSGIAQLVQIRKYEKGNAGFTVQNQAEIFSASNAALPPTTITEIKNLVQQGRKIEAVKFYREVTGTSLKNAKEAVERIEVSPSAAPEFVAPPRGSIYDTGELTAPPSVTEQTTRHLQMDKEGETMTLPPRNDL